MSPIDTGPELCPLGAGTFHARTGFEHCFGCTQCQAEASMRCAPVCPHAHRRGGRAVMPRRAHRVGDPKIVAFLRDKAPAAAGYLPVRSLPRVTPARHLLPSQYIIHEHL
jgi:hypothetical protein